MEKQSYTAKEYTPEIKRKKMFPTEVKLPQCESCKKHAVDARFNTCLSCGHKQDGTES